MKKIVALFAGCNNDQSAEGGSTHYLSSKSEAERAWLVLSAVYTEQTGVEVKLVTAASGSWGRVVSFRKIYHRRRSWAGGATHCPYSLNVPPSPAGRPRKDFSPENISLVSPHTEKAHKLPGYSRIY